MQIEQETLAMACVVERFNFYLFDQPFTLITENKQLGSIFKNKTQIKATCNNRKMVNEISELHLNTKIQTRKA